MNSYTKRTLTDPDDRFIAILALAEEYSNRYGEKLGSYLAGHWWNLNAPSFVRSLA